MFETFPSGKLESAPAPPHVRGVDDTPFLSGAGAGGKQGLKEDKTSTFQY